MGRSPCCSKVGLRRGPWSAKEDSLLANYIQQHGEGQWRSLPKKAGLLRCGKSCRLRWMNYLRPGIKRGNISQDEEDLIVRLHGLLGNRWSLIAGRLPGRTDNEIKNYWNTHLLKKLITAGIHPNPNKHLPKPPAKKQRKKQQQPQQESAAEGQGNDNIDGNRQTGTTPMTKVYLPKPIRVSPLFSRTSSDDSSENGASSSEGSGVSAEKLAEVASYVPWLPIFELEDGGYFGEDFLNVGCATTALHHRSDPVSGEINMWEQVYDEYFRLL